MQDYKQIMKNATTYKIYGIYCNFAKVQKMFDTRSLKIWVLILNACWIFVKHQWICKTNTETQK